MSLKRIEKPNNIIRAESLDTTPVCGWLDGHKKSNRKVLANDRMSLIAYLRFVEKCFVVLVGIESLSCILHGA